MPDPPLPSDLGAQRWRWIRACVLAEALGMTAAAAAARAASHLLEVDVSQALLLGFVLVVCAGLVEGTALAVLQSRVLAGVLGASGRRRWQLATVLVAGLGWAVGSAPSTLAAPDASGDQPGLVLVLFGAAAIGAVMGAVLGAVQAWAVRGRVRHPWRWVGASAAAWTPAMVVIFAGATTAGADWPWYAVVVLGTATGVVAGAVLGAVSGLFLPTLQGLPLRHLTVLSRLRTPARRFLSPGLVGLAVRGGATGRTYRFPGLAAEDDAKFVVFPGHPERKVWWRSLGRGRDIQVPWAGAGTTPPLTCSSTTNSGPSASGTDRNTSANVPAA